MDIRLQIGRKGDAAVGKHGLRRLIARIVGNAFRGAAFYGHTEYILAAFPIGAEIEVFAIRRPDGVGIVGRIGRQRPGRSALDTDNVNVTLVGKGDLRSVRRQGVLAKPFG